MLRRYKGILSLIVILTLLVGATGVYAASPVTKQISVNQTNQSSTCCSTPGNTSCSPIEFRDLQPEEKTKYEAIVLDSKELSKFEKKLDPQFTVRRDKVKSMLLDQQVVV